MKTFLKEEKLLVSCFAESHVLMLQGNLIMTRHLPPLTSGNQGAVLDSPQVIKCYPSTIDHYFTIDPKTDE